MRAGLKDEDRRRTVQALLDLGCNRAGVADAVGVHPSSVSFWLQKPSDDEAREQLKAAKDGEPPVDWKDKRLTGPKVRALVADWRERELDRDQVLAELEALFPPNRTVQERLRLKREGAA